MKMKEEKSKNKWKIISSVGILVLLLVLVVVLTCRDNNQTGAISPELARAMTYEEFEDGDDAVEGTDNVKFSAFFLRDINADGYAEKIKGTCKAIGKSDILYMEINVQTAGFLKDAKIQINGQNFYLQTALPKDNELKDNYIGDNIKQIEFNQLENGTQKLLMGAVRSGNYNYTSTKADAIGNNINNYSREDNEIILTGTYVDEDGNETPIIKKVDLTMDWYGTTNTSFDKTYQDGKITETSIDEDSNTIKFDFLVKTKENDWKLNISKSYVEGVIPELNGYQPIEVNLVGDTADFSYDAETRKFTIQKESTVDSTGKITDAIGVENSYNVQVIYPLEAYETLGTDTVEIRVPVQAYYEGYNNPNTEFSNPYRSNIARTTIVANFERIVGEIARFEVTVGRRIVDPNEHYVVSKQKPIRIYNGVSESEKDDTYLVTWYAYTGVKAPENGLIIKETKTGEIQENDQFIKTDGTAESMENVSTNVGIYFGNAMNILGEEGWIKVYDDETDDLLMTFDKSNLNEYTSTNPYKYEIPVKHIRVETSNITSGKFLIVYNIKELDDDYITENYTEEEFGNLQYIKSTVSGYLGDMYINQDIEQADYEAPYSIAYVSLSKSAILTQETEKNEKITIRATANENYNQVKWENGSFLVKLPAEIISAEINSVTIDNSNVQLTSYELIEIDGNKFIKINTENETSQTYTITIDVNLSPDPRIVTTTSEIELYASNEAGCDYYYKAEDIYDVNDNLNIQEKVNKTTTDITFVSPNSLLTSQIASNYDDKGSTVISPEVADVKPVYSTVDNEEKTAEIGVQIKNNYSSTISEVLILGKIPFEGNTYAISGKDLGSSFTTKMTSDGIQVPEELEGKVTVYYSENENPGKEIDNTDNGWKVADEVTNWDNIKTFLIDFNDYVIEVGDEFVFEYTIKIPNGLDFNQVAYSHHGVYFNLDTEEGKYRTQTEPNRLGFRIAEKYNLELSKYQSGKDKLVPGATYKVTEEGQEEGKTAVTNSEGKLIINNLYAEKTYTIQEIKSPSDYELNEGIIKIIAHVDDNGKLTVEKLDGTTREDVSIEKNEGEDYKLIVKVEDEAKAKLKIVKKEQGTENLIKGIRYKVTGANLPEDGKVIMTNANGEASLNGLKINEEYTLQEVKAEGYYLASQIIFKIVNNDGTFELQIIEGEVKESSLAEEDSLPTGNLVLEDEKIPTYTLEITKIKKTIDVNANEDELIAQAEQAIATDAQIETLAGAKFKLYKDGKEIGEYITGEDGKIVIDNLYQYVEGKDENATYTLKEVLAPEGYAKVKDITFKVQEVDGELQFQAQDDKERSYTSEGSTLKLQIADSPAFKLIKRDQETQEIIPNAKFAIYNVEDGEYPARDSKGEILGTKEIIDGKEYYTLTTNENGEITADLQEGLYKAVEVQAPDKYDIANQIYYFGIGVSRETDKRLGIKQTMSMEGGSIDDIYSVVETSDGGIVAGGYYVSKTLQVGDEILINAGDGDGFIIKYDAEGEVEWTRSIGGSEYEKINSVAETSDGGIIAGGYFESSTIQIGNEILTNSGSSFYDAMIVKYNAEGEVEWARSIGGINNDQIETVAETSDGGFIAGAHLGTGTTVQVGSDTVAAVGGCIIKYTTEGEVEWIRDISSYYNESVIETSDGGYIVGGYYTNGTVLQVGSETLTNAGYDDGIIIKYNAEKEVEWVRSIGGSSVEHINSVVETSDGGFIAGGYFYNSAIQVGNETLTSAGGYDGIIIKYTIEGEVEWVRSIGGSENDFVESITETNDGGFIVGGTFLDDVQIGNKTLTSSGWDDIMIIKYDASGEVEWTGSIGGNDMVFINTLIETSDGDYLIGGNFYGTIQVENKILTNQDYYSPNGMIIRYGIKEVSNVVENQARSIGGRDGDQINSVAETSDGGYIAGGIFYSSTIQVGNETLTNAGNGDGMIIKYNAEGDVKWANRVGGSDDDWINSVTETSDGGYIVGGVFYSSTIQVGNETLTSAGYGDGLIIKYNAQGEVEWVRSIGGSYYEYINSVTETSDGAYIAVGEFNSDILQIENETLMNAGNYDGMVIKYNKNGELEWVRGIGESDYEYIESVVATKDGGIISGGEFASSTLQVGDETLTNAGYCDVMIIKYNAEGVIEWARRIGGDDNDYIGTVAETSSGGCIVGGYFYSDEVQVGNQTLTNTGNCDGIVIKYNAEGEVDWARSTVGYAKEGIDSVKETRDGGIIAGGFFYGVIRVEDETLGTMAKYDGMVIKYNAEGIVEWIKSIGGSDSCEINSVAETTDGGIVAGGYFYSSTLQVGDETLTNAGSYDGMIVKYQSNAGVPEVQEVVAENVRKEFNITTDIKEIDGTKGGSISGEDEETYEIVKYGDSSIKEVKMIPDEGYEIISITVNGEEYKFKTLDDGTYVMPIFTNVVEDKHIEVTYSLKDNKITINKVDAETGESLSGAKFKLDQIEERTEPGEDIIGELTANGSIYALPDRTNEISDALGTLTNNGTYYFVEENGTYIPTNSLTYQTATGGTAGIGGVTANSYIPIDLSSKTGTYAVEINAEVSSEYRYDYGYVTITETTDAPKYNNSDGRIAYMSGTWSADDYTSILLEGGKTYYLHLGYRKDGSGDEGDDKFTVNSVKVYAATPVTYNFIENDGKYESNNQGMDETVANSYIPIDLTNYTGRYNIIVNAEISSEDSYDYGYVAIRETTTAPSYNSSSGRFVYITGTQEAQDYSTVLQGGKMYYLHLGYYKDEMDSEGDDKFTVNSIQITLNDSELYHTEVETNSEGQAITQIPFGKYSITEIQAPEGYELNETPTIIEFREGQDSEFEIENQKQARVTVHHYIKGTTTKLAEDEIVIGKVGEKYTTSPQLNLQKYELEIDTEGNYIMPANATGTYEEYENEVTYYYVEKSIPLTVHHYIEGTQNKVPLLDGSEAQDVISEGMEGEEYTTSAISEDELSAEYELATTPENATGTYNGDEIIVTYYYKKVERNLVLTKYQEDGTTLLEGAKFTIESEDNTDSEQQNVYTTDANGKIKTTLETGVYAITEIEAPEGYSLPEDPTTELTITKETEEAEISLDNTKTQGTVIVHHYIEGTTNKVPLQDGTLAEDEVKTGTIGDIYVTKELENIGDKYEFTELPDNSSGTITEDTIEVTYYYSIKDGKVIVHHYKENTTESLSADVTKIGKVDSEYTTEAATDIPVNYELAETPSNATGAITLEDTEVIYYYKLKTPSIETPEITKTTTTEKVTEVGQKIPYTITYTANIDKYIGDGIVTIVDQLPYAIDTTDGKSSLDGGTYDETNKTITWTENITGIDTFTDGIKQINITKNIELTYKDLDVTKDKVANTSTGKIELKTPEKEDTVTTSKEILTEFLIDIKVTKVWQDTETQVQKRPKNVILVVKNGDTEVTRQEINADNQEGEDTSKWSYIFTGLDKYDETGNEISYTVDELEKQENDLYFYTKTVGEITGTGDAKEVTITNTFTKPDDEISIKVNKVWVDQDNIYQKRPASLELQIKYGVAGDEATSKIITVGTEDSYTFANLDKYDENGDEIIYTADEKEVNEGDLFNYTKQVGALENIEGQTDQKQITITNTMTKIPANVTVKYVDKVSGNEILDAVVKEGIVGENFDVSENKKDIEGYTLVEEPAEKTGTYTEEEQTKTYYYAQTSKVIVKYLDKNTNEVITDEQQYEIAGYEGKEYETEQKEITDYTFIESTNNTEGTMTKETIEVIYYYAKTTKVIVKYLEKDTNTVLTDEQQYEITGYEGKTYETEQKEISGYSFVENTNNTKGTMTEEEIEVIYYYAQNTKVTVLHIDKATGDVLKQETQDGKVGDVYEAHAEDIEGYVVVEKPDEESIVMTKEEQTLTYYYSHISAGLIEKHIDDITGEVIYTETHQGNEGDSYNIPSKTFEGYDLVESKLPTNAQGTMTQDVIEVKYYYIKKATVKVEYIDKSTGNKLADDIIISGHENDEYTTEAKDFQKYTLEEMPENATGKMTVTKNEDGSYNTETLVQYYYNLKTPIIETPVITKTSTITKVTEAEQKIPYTITYTANIDQYFGDGVVTIVDQLPYEIDTADGKSNLDGGVYDETNKTITWTENIAGIDTYTNGKKQINITKNIEVTYKDLDVTEDKVTNTATGKIELKTPEKENTVTTNKEIPAEFLINIKATKVWEDSDTQEEKRPESVILVVKNGDTEVARQEISADNQEGTDISKWSYTFTGLSKYDENGNEINYTVDEIETQENDLYFYTKTVGEITGTGDAKEVTITNTFTKPSDKISIKVNKVWVDKENVYEKRPDSLELQIKNATTGDEVASKTITVKTEESYTFTNLEKYDENGNEIIYTADEKEVSEGDLYNYTKQVGTLEDIEGQTSQKQITITNTMSKIPGSVIVKYVDKVSGSEISDIVVKEGIVGENFDISESKKDIVGYTLIEEPAEKTGTYTEEEQTKTYYYAKNTKVIVKYLEKGTNKILTEDSQYEIEGYEGLSYITALKTITGYTYIEDTGNTAGNMQRDTIEVIYYYAKDSKVIVKYLDKATNTALTQEPQYEIVGYEGKEYETEQKEISGYTFIESTNNTEGTMTEETIEVNYYYAKNTKVIVKYLEKDTNTVLTEEAEYEIAGYEGKEYETEQKEISGYTFVESTNNTEGTMTKEEIEVIYYYAQNTKATVVHKDKLTGEILKQETKEGKVGDVFETHAEDIEDYVLVERPEEPDVVMTKEEQIVEYYYVHISKGVIEKHIDDITGEILYTESYEGKEGDEYNIPSRTFEGYDLVESKLPENAQGKMTKDVIEVKYYYIKKASVKVEYIDKLTGNKLAEDVIIDGHENDEYTTEQKEFENYILEKVPENATGKMQVTKNEDGSYNTETLVQYYYVKESAGVLEKHIDIRNNEILAQKQHTGKVGDEYNIPAREFENYELVEIDDEGNNRLPTNSKGNMEESLIEVNYYYIKKLKVTVEYIDKQTGEIIDTYEIIGEEGYEYEAEDKQFDGYDLDEIPDNKKGKITDSSIVVKYYYDRRAEVEVKFLEKDTENSLLESENIVGHVGDKYQARQKDIPYYNFVESTSNVEGTMEKDKITVIYYYEKQIFNLKVDKWISAVTMDGILQGGKTLERKDELFKMDIHRKKISTADVKVTYKVRVSNIGEIEGSADKLTEVIPSGYSFHEEDNKVHWENNDGILTTTVLKGQTIKPGEFREIEITLRWNNSEDNFGQKDNIVVLDQMNNPAGYQDVNKDDNKSKASMLIAIATGLDGNSMIVLMGIIQIILVISMVILLIYRKKEKVQKDIN